MKELIATFTIGLMCEYLVVRLVFAKIGYLGVTSLIEGLLDERAIRTDVIIRSVSSGCKMGEEDGLEIAKSSLTLNPDLIILISPHVGGPGPTARLNLFEKCGKPVLVLTDLSSAKVIQKVGERGFGYILTEADPMIGVKESS